MRKNKGPERRFNYQSIDTKENSQQTGAETLAVMPKKEEDSEKKQAIKAQRGNLVGGKRKVKKVKAKVVKANVLPSIKKVEDEVLKSIVGQDEQVRKILTAIYKSSLFDTLKSNILVIGNSGTGKTETVKQIAKRLNLPYTVEDATKYTKEGYYGNSVEEMVYNLLEAANGNLRAAEHGIIIIDEIDKKAGHDSNDVSGVEVLKSLLKIVEGTTMYVETGSEANFDIRPFNTEKVTIVFMGAFSGIKEFVNKRLKTKHLGFSGVEDAKEKNPKVLKQDLVEYGLPEEFVGRIDTIVQMNELKEKELASILKNSELSIFKRYKQALKNMGITLQYDDEIYECIAKESLAISTGARELTNTVNYIFENIMYEVISSPKKFHKCKLSTGVVKDNTKYELR